MFSKNCAVNTFGTLSKGKVSNGTLSSMCKLSDDVLSNVDLSSYEDTYLTSVSNNLVSNEKETKQMFSNGQHLTGVNYAKGEETLNECKVNGVDRVLKTTTQTFTNLNEYNASLLNTDKEESVEETQITTQVVSKSWIGRIIERVVSLLNKGVVDTTTQSDEILNSNLVEEVKYNKTTNKVSSKQVLSNKEKDLTDVSKQMLSLRLDSKLSWKNAREKLNISEVYFHKTVRVSKVYRDIVVDELNKRVAEGWTTTRSLSRLTGIDEIESLLNK